MQGVTVVQEEVRLGEWLLGNPWIVAIMYVNLSGDGPSATVEYGGYKNAYTLYSELNCVR